MIRLILLIVCCVLVLVSGAQSAEPVKKTSAGTCFDSDHPNYNKVKNYVSTYQTLEECIKSGGKTPLKNS